jgi:hypothetical protein
MRSEIKRARTTGRMQCTVSSESGEPPRDPQERQSASPSAEGKRSPVPTQTQVEHSVCQALFSCGCEQFRPVGETPGGHSLCQESFFVCTVKKIGNLPGAGSIFVETVVDCDSGTAFAKVYSEKSAMNAVDILRSRAMPHFQRRGCPIDAVHTLRRAEYCGLSPVHPFEAYLSASHIRHFSLSHACPRCRERCQRFYRLLLKDFFVPALRRNFQFSLSSLQKELDAFVESHNALHPEEEQESRETSWPSANFSVHP